MIDLSKFSMNSFMGDTMFSAKKACLTIAVSIGLVLSAQAGASAAGGESEFDHASALSRHVAESPEPAKALKALPKSDRDLVLKYSTPARSTTTTKVVPMDDAARASVARNNGRIPSTSDLQGRTPGVQRSSIIWTGCWQTTVERSAHGIVGNKLYGFTLVGGWCVNTRGVSSAKYDASWVHSNLWFGWTSGGIQNKGAAVISNTGRIFVQYKFNYTIAPTQEDHPCLRIFGYENSNAGTDWGCSIY